MAASGSAVASPSPSPVVVEGPSSPLVSQGSGSQPARGTASKYDFVKVPSRSVLLPTLMADLSAEV